MSLNQGQVIFLAVFVTSIVGATIALVVEAPAIGRMVVLPALLISGWAFFGHFITLDDEMPGEWSNPDGSREIWLRSVLELVVKLTIFGAVVWLFFAQQQP